MIPLTGHGAYHVSGLIPTAYQPHALTFSADGRCMYIINGKSVTGPNPGHLTSSTGRITHFTYPGGNAAAAVASRASNQYQLQLERASLVSARQCRRAGSCGTSPTSSPTTTSIRRSAPTRTRR